MNKKTTAAPGSNNERELELRYESVVNKFKPNAEICSRLAYITPYWLPASIYFAMVDMTRAYTRDMARIIVKHLKTFLSGGGQTLTGIDSVDRQLMVLYQDIYESAQENGEELGWPVF